MKTITKEFYSFSELSDDTRKYLIKANAKINVLKPYWYDWVSDSLKKRMVEKGFDEPDIHFKGFDKPRDGACFDAAPKLSFFLEKVGATQLAIDKIRKADIFLSIVRTGDWHKSKDASTRVMRLEVDSNNIVYRQNSEVIRKALKASERARKSMCNSIYKDIIEEYNFLTHSEAVENAIVKADDMFTADGHEIMEEVVKPEEDIIQPVFAESKLDRVFDFYRITILICKKSLGWMKINFTTSF